MSSAKAALESDTRVSSVYFLSRFRFIVISVSWIAFLTFIVRCLLSKQEENTESESTQYLLVSILYHINNVSTSFFLFTDALIFFTLFLLWFAGPLRSRAAKAIGFIDTIIEYSLANAPLQKELSAGDFPELDYNPSLFPIFHALSFPWLLSFTN